MNKVLSALGALSLCACSAGDPYSDGSELERALAAGDDPEAISLAAKRDLLVELTAAAGHEESFVQFFDEDVIVEGDMLLDVDDAIARFSPTVDKQFLSKKHTFDGGRVSNDYNDRIQVSIDANVPSEWHPDIAIAMTKWNAIRGSRVVFRPKSNCSPCARPPSPRVGIPKGHVHVSMRDLPDGTAGFAAYPRATVHTSGLKIKKVRKPGPYVYLDPIATGYAPVDRQSLVMHELGHTIGFDHTRRDASDDSSQSGTRIEGTPLYDPDSVMVSGGYPADLSVGDHIAAVKVYPNGQAPEFQCYPGEQRCSGSHVQSCLSSGRGWNQGTHCRLGCSGARCNRSCEEICQGHGQCEAFTPECAKPPPPPAPPPPPPPPPTRPTVSSECERICQGHGQCMAFTPECN